MSCLRVGQSVLLVEDNPDDETLALRTLRSVGMGGRDIVVARDGVEAIEAINQRDRRFALIALDLKLPRIDGFGVLDAVRGEERTRYVPVVILTSSDEPSDVLRGYELGANSYLRKPIAFDEYLDAVSTMFRYWLQINQPS